MPSKWDTVRRVVRDHVIDERIYADKKWTALDDIRQRNRMEAAGKVRRKTLGVRRIMQKHESIVYAFMTLLKVYSLGMAIYNVAKQATPDAWSVAHLCLTSVSFLLHLAHTFAVLRRPIHLRQRSKSLLYTPRNTLLKIALGVIGISTLSVMLAKHVVQKTNASSIVLTSLNILVTLVFVSLDVWIMIEALRYQKTVSLNIIRLWRTPTM